MFTRLQKTAYILSHREEKPLPHFTPEVEFVEHKPPQYSTISKFLAYCLGIVVFLFVIRVGITPAVHWLERITGHPEASLTAVGIIGALMWFAIDRGTATLRDFIKKQFGIVLTPHLGRRIEETYRILRG